MFKFNFQVEDSTKEKTEDLINNISADEEAREIFVGDNTEKYNFKSIIIEEIHFFIRDLEDPLNNVDFNFLKTFKNCDVVPTIYEGGLKVWECTYDLLKFLEHNRKFCFEGKKVLDLGCGCGLLGIYAALKRAKIVHFQDYNAEVLESFTIPNVHQNRLQSEFKYFNSDWSAFASSNLVNVSYDYILSSEILYNVESYPKLYDLFGKILAPEGKIIIASKSYYFGVGGSVKKFQIFVQEQNEFNIDTIWKNMDGVQREILLLEKRDNTYS